LVSESSDLLMLGKVTKALSYDMSNWGMWWANMPLELNERELQEELERAGLTPELFATIIASSPARQIVLGYPQERVDTISVVQNW
jgi:hypothetical protein